MSSTNIIVKIENVDDNNNNDDDIGVDGVNEIDELIVPVPLVDSSSSHDNDEPATTSLHELSLSPDHQLLPREQDDTTEKQDQSSSTLDDTSTSPPEEKPDQSSSDTTSLELPPSADDTTDNTNLLTPI